MCRRQNSFFKIIWAIALVTFLTTVASADFTDETFLWVAGQMSMDQIDHKPIIRFINKQEIRTIFKLNNQKSYIRWEARYGVDQAQEILTSYLKELIGLFIPKTNTIFVGNWQSPCQMRATLAHELTHFFQYQSRTLDSQSETLASNQRLGWEMEANQIEHIYLRSHCPDMTATIAADKSNLYRYPPR